ncbi:alpha/beta fold hydrolase [Marinibaculum pumilum]|uniref:Alpha/beta fold hydrolase n=1 Tax=Marinibaculum pumilum TaxID=1766165 RepID=A0ABV7KXI9_9PROT
MRPRLHFDVHEGDGPPLLLVHGFMSSRAQWAANLPALKRVASPVTVELWGHGRSPVPEDPALHDPRAYAEQFEAIRNEIGGESWYAVGQSFGAGLTLRYSLLCPEALFGQAFTNSLSGLASDGPDAAAERAARLRGLFAAGAPLTELPFHPRNGRRLHPAVRAALEADAGLLTPAGLLGCIEGSRPTLSVLGDLERIAVPTLMVVGVWEKAFLPLAALAQARLPGLRTVRLDGGHSINAEAVAAFDAALAAHLADCRAAEPARKAAP